MKNKKKILTLIIILVLLIILAVGTCAVLYFTTDIFKVDALMSNDQLFAKYISQENSIVNLLKADIIEEQKQFMKDNSYTSTGELSITQKAGQNEQNVKITTNSQYNNTNKRSFSQATLKNGQEDLMKISYINSDDIYALKCDSVYEHYIGIRNKNLKQFMTTMGVPEEVVVQMPDVISLEGIKNTNLISKQDEQYLVDTYLPIIANNIPKENYSKTTAMLETGHQAEGYALTLNEQDISQIVLAILTKAKEDAATITILENMLFTLGMEEEQISQIDFQQELEDLIDELQTSQPESETLIITVYQVDGKTAAMELEVSDGTKLIFNIVSNTPTNQKVTISMKYGQTSAATTTTQMTIEKAVSETETIYSATIQISNKNTDYQITADTTLGKVTNNVIHNVSNVSIQEYNGNTIDISYNKAIEKATQEVEIEELKPSNTVIANNYPKEQLEPFMETIIQKYGQTTANAITKLNLKQVTSDDVINSVAGSVLAVTNANGEAPIVNLIGVVAITTFNQVQYLQTDINEIR